MNTNVICNQEWARPQNSLIDITPLTRVLQIRHPTFISTGIADSYRLSACPQIGERPALDDLVWAISQAVEGSTPTRPWPSDSGPAIHRLAVMTLGGRLSAADIEADRLQLEQRLHAHLDQRCIVTRKRNQVLSTSRVFFRVMN
jgi:hypothetical protein